jgi:hypothetical protein
MNVQGGQNQTSTFEPATHWIWVKIAEEGGGNAVVTVENAVDR